MQAALKEAIKTFDPQTASGLPQSSKSSMNTGWGQVNQLVRQGFESLKQAQAEYPIEIRHILCDHLGGEAWGVGKNRGGIQPSGHRATDPVSGAAV